MTLAGGADGGAGAGTPVALGAGAMAGLQAGAGRVRVVTDSLAWLPAEVTRTHDITVVPLHVFFGTEEFTETVDLTNEEFYRRLTTTKQLPKTSAPSPGAFLNAYRSVAGGAAGILVVCFTSKLSGTYRSAEVAAGTFREERPDVPIEVIDTETAAMAEGIVAIRAAEEAAAGASYQEVVRNARALVPKTRIYFLLETLEYLHKGGRIGGAKAFLGGLLHIRPILTVTNGEVAPVGRERTRAKAMERILDSVAQYAQGRPLGHACILHAVAEEYARELAALVEQRFTLERPMLFTEIGPVIGTYVGPGAIGVTFHCD